MSCCCKLGKKKKAPGKTGGKFRYLRYGITNGSPTKTIEGEPPSEAEMQETYERNQREWERLRKRKEIRTKHLLGNLFSKAFKEGAINVVEWMILDLWDKDRSNPEISAELAKHGFKYSKETIRKLVPSPTDIYGDPGPLVLRIRKIFKKQKNQKYENGFPDELEDRVTTHETLRSEDKDEEGINIEQSGLLEDKVDDTLDDTPDDPDEELPD